MTPSTAVADGFFTPLQAAEYLGVSRATVWNLMARKKLPYCRLPGTRLRRIPVRVVRELAAKSLVGTEVLVKL